MLCHVIFICVYHVFYAGSTTCWQKTCDTSNGGCYVNDNGLETCSCNTGYTLGPDGVTCSLNERMSGWLTISFYLFLCLCLDCLKIARFCQLYVFSIAYYNVLFCPFVKTKVVFHQCICSNSSYVFLFH